MDGAFCKCAVMFMSIAVAQSEVMANRWTCGWLTTDDDAIERCKAYENAQTVLCKSILCAHANAKQILHVIEKGTLAHKSDGNARNNGARNVIRLVMQHFTCELFACLLGIGGALLTPKLKYTHITLDDGNVDTETRQSMSAVAKVSLETEEALFENSQLRLLK